MSEARRVATSLAETEARDQEQSQTTKIAIRRKALLRVLKIFSLTQRNTCIIYSLWCLASFLVASNSTDTGLGPLGTP
jgi:hypothetical protein